jgi:hypothetical protein
MDLGLSGESRVARVQRARADVGPDGPDGHADSAERALFVPGDVVDPFEVHGPTDETVAVAFDGAFERTLLLVFAEDCGACALVLPDWRDVFATTAEGTRVVALQLDATGPPEADDERLPVAIHRPTGDVGLPLDKITKVPLTAVLDAAGMVTWVHYGTLDPRTVEGLRAAVR